jgi:hypothetical protein
MVTNLSGVNKEERYHKRKNAQAQQQLDDTSNNPGKTSSPNQVARLAAAHSGG